MNDRHQQKPYPLRMPETLRERLEEAAKASSRSLHAEIVSRLENSFPQSLEAELLQARIAERNKVEWQIKYLEDDLDTQRRHFKRTKFDVNSRDYQEHLARLTRIEARLEQLGALHDSLSKDIAAYEAHR